jgi:hypothetical protein
MKSEISSTHFCLIILIIIQIFLVIRTEALAKCDVFINNRTYRNGMNKYFSFKSQYYEIFFGLPPPPGSNQINHMYHKKNKPIGYFIDVNCTSPITLIKQNNNSIIVSPKNKKQTFLYDINYIAIEININNCLGELIIKNVTLTNDNYLKFHCDFHKLYNNSLSIQLSLNRRLGDGCSNNVLFYSKKFNDLYDYDEDDDDLGFDEFLNNLKLFFKDMWQSVNVSPTCLFGFIVSILFLINLIVILLIFFIKKKRIGSRKKVLEINNNSIIRLKNLRKKSSAFAPKQNNDPAFSMQICNDDDNGSNNKNSKNVNNSKRSIRNPSLKSGNITASDLNEFQQLRQNIVDNSNYGGDYEKIVFDKNNIEKHLIFQQQAS